ncbi:MAG: TonB-dependent receptor plug domain-containing protein, partial [Bryobacteraceae bacterium]
MQKCVIPALFSFCVLLTAPLTAQEVRSDTVIVTGSYEPIPLEESNRAVDVFDLTAQSRLLACSIADFLRLDPSVDVQARGPDLVQADLSIRGGNFGATLVMVNGMRVSDPQTGHFNLDIPIPLDAIGRMEVLKGSGSAIYGSDAVDGVVNIITRTPEATDFRLRTAVGNFGTNQQSGAVTLVERKFTEQLSFSRDFSTGFMDDRDYRNVSLASATHWRSRLGATDVLLAGDDRPYGANQFYGNFNSWERVKSWYAAARQEIG